MVIVNILLQNGQLIKNVSVDTIINNTYDGVVIKKALCPGCGGECIPVNRINAKPYYSSRHHAQGCPYYTTLVKTKLGNFKINEQTLLSHKDSAVRDKTSQALHDTGDSSNSSDDIAAIDKDLFIVEKALNVNNARDFYRCMQYAAPNDILLNGLSKKEIEFSSRNRFYMRSKQHQGLLLVEARRVIPPEDLHIPHGYMCFVEDSVPYEERYNKIYFLVRVRRDDRNNELAGITMGINGYTRDPHSNIVILGDWVLYQDPKYVVYLAQITSRQYAFLNLEEGQHGR